MNMIHKYRVERAMLSVLLVFLLSGCSDWLRVEDLDKRTETQVFTSASGIQEALNGVYVMMGANALYGRDMSVGTIELLGQQYALSGATSDNNALKYSMLNYSFSTDTPKDKLLSIWKQAYKAILNVNNFIDMLNKTEDVIANDEKNTLLGEAYGLRAYLHLDMLRLYGPIYLTDSTNISIPYRAEPKIEYSERIAANKVMENIMKDLEQAIGLLKDDPVITLGTMRLPEDSLSTEQKKVNKFYRKREQRMNYYAANALKVRALMYRNNKAEAAELAKSLLTVIDEKFPWATNYDVFLNTKEDRIFSSEMMFGVYATDMYSNWTDYFSPGITSEATVYVTTTSVVESLFEVVGGLSLSSDWRSYNWKDYTQNSLYQCTYKLSKSTKETTSWYIQPLIRKTELYYAIAEAEEDVAYVNTVRSKRNIKRVEDVRPAYDIEEEVQNEFRREMHNEGQIFFFYKRKNLSSIPSGSSTGTVSMSPAKYVIPVPADEIDK